jgi:HEPN domain-containing protein
LFLLVNAGWHKSKHMDFRTFAPWEHYPKTLSQKEIENPLMVVEDFFSSDSLEGHAKRLKEWRYFVINNKVYTNDRHGPGTLLYLYDLNLKILEAIYLLLMRDQNTFGNEKVPEEQLGQEKEEWRYFPKNLSAKELLYPYKAIKKVFKKISPQQYREYLHEWVHQAFYNRADNESLYASEVITVYENLLKVYSAAWMIFQRDTDRTQLKKDWPKIEQENSSDKVFELRSISPKPTKAEALGLAELQKVILKVLPTVQMIVHLGTHQNPFTYYLLVLIAADDNTPEHHVANKLEDHCKYLSDVHIFVHKAGSAISGISVGQRFWVSVRNKGNIVYQAPGVELPEHGVVTNEVLAFRAKFHWERWGGQGKEFLNGAEFYRSQDNLRLAAFLLHQAVESTLKAIIQAVLGYRIQMHNLSRLLKITMLFTDDLSAVFDLHTEAGTQQFDLLQSAYTKSRYQNEFNPDGKLVFEISKTVKKLIVTAELIYKQYLIEVG